MDELESYASVHSELSFHVMSTARRAWVVKHLTEAVAEFGLSKALKARLMKRKQRTQA